MGRALDHPAPYPPHHHTDQDRRDGDEQGRLDELERPEPVGRVVDHELLDALRVQELRVRPEEEERRFLVLITLVQAATRDTVAFLDGVLA